MAIPFNARHPANEALAPASASASAAISFDEAALARTAKIFEAALAKSERISTVAEYATLSRPQVAQVLQRVLAGKTSQQRVLQVAIEEDLKELSLDLLAAMSMKEATQLLQKLSFPKKEQRDKLMALKAIVAKACSLEESCSAATLAQMATQPDCKDLIVYLECCQKMGRMEEKLQKTLRLLRATKGVVDGGRADNPQEMLTHFLILSDDEIKLVGTAITYADAAKAEKHKLVSKELPKILLHSHLEIGQLVRANQEGRTEDAYKAMKKFEARHARLPEIIVRAVLANPLYEKLAARCVSESYGVELTKLIQENKVEEALHFISKMPFEIAATIITAGNNEELKKCILFVREAVHYFTEKAPRAERALPQIVGSDNVRKILIALVAQTVESAKPEATSRGKALEPLLAAWKKSRHGPETLKLVVATSQRMMDELQLLTVHREEVVHITRIKELQKELKAGNSVKALASLMKFQLDEQKLISAEIERVELALQRPLEAVRALQDEFVKAAHGAGLEGWGRLFLQYTEEEMAGPVREIAESISVQYQDAKWVELIIRFLKLFPNCGKEYEKMIVAITDLVGPISRAALWPVLVRFNPSKKFGGIHLEGDIPALLGALPQDCEPAKVIGLIRHLQSDNQAQFWRAAFSLKSLRWDIIKPIFDWVEATYPENKQLLANVKRNHTYFDWLVAKTQLSRDPVDYQAFYERCKQQKLLLDSDQLELIAAELASMLPESVEDIFKVKTQLEAFGAAEGEIRTYVQKGNIAGILRSLKGAMIDLRRFALDCIATSSSPHMQLLTALHEALNTDDADELDRKFVACHEKIMSLGPLKEAIQLYEGYLYLYGKNETVQEWLDQLQNDGLVLEKAYGAGDLETLSVQLEEIESGIEYIFENIFRHNPAAPANIKMFVVERIMQDAMKHYIEAANTIAEKRKASAREIDHLRMAEWDDRRERFVEERRVFTELLHLEHTGFEDQQQAVTILRRMCRHMGLHEALQFLRKEIGKRPKEKEILEELCDLVSFAVDPQHFTRGAIKVAIKPKPDGSHMREALALFDGLTFLDPTKKPSFDPKVIFPEYRRTFEEMREKWTQELQGKNPDLKGEALEVALQEREKRELPLFIRRKLENLISVIESKNADFAPSNPEAFYTPYENGFIHVVRKLQQNEREATPATLEAAKAETAAALFAFIRTVGYCYTAMRSTNLNLYRTVVLGLPDSLEEQVYEELANYRSILFQSSLTPDSYQSIHYLTLAIQMLGKKYGIPDTEEYLKGGLDRFETGAPFEERRDSVRFEGIYSVSAATKWAYDLLSKNKKAQYIDWWKSHVPATWTAEECTRAKTRVDALRAEKKSDPEVAKMLEEEFQIPHKVFFTAEEMKDAARKKGAVPAEKIEEAYGAHKKSIEEIEAGKRASMKAAAGNFQKIQAGQKAAREACIQAENALEQALQVPKSVVLTVDEMLKRRREELFLASHVYEGASTDLKREGVMRFLSQINVFSAA